MFRVLPLTLLTRHTADPDVTTRLRVARTSPGPASVRFRPAPFKSEPSDPNWAVSVPARELKLIRAVPERLPMVPLENAYELSRTRVAVAWTVVSVTGPAATSAAEIVTWLKFRLATWVRNGKPPMLTDGLLDRPFCWILLAMTFSATALAPKSSPSRTATMTTMVTSHRLVRLGP